MTALVLPPHLRGELERVAADETRHAELAYVFAAWALKRDPKLRRIVESELAAWEQEPLPAAPGLNSWGVLDVQQRRAIRRDGMRLVVRPLVTQLLAATPPLDEHDPSANSLYC